MERRGTFLPLAVFVVLTLAAVGLSSAQDASANTGFKLPWTAGEKYRVGQSWGGSTHTGYNYYAYDFSLPVGTAVRAAAAGRVVAAVGSNTGGGCDPSYADRANYIYILHPDGTKTFYLHLRDVSVSVNQQVVQGELIGHSGQTGYVCGAHLHFQRDNSSGTSTQVYFDEYKGQQLSYNQSVTSQNSPDDPPPPAPSPRPRP